MSKHAAKRGRHAKRPEPYQGWGQAPDHTPPMGFPAVDVADELALSYTSPAPEPVHYRPYPAPAPVQRRGLSAPMRLFLAGATAFGFLMLGATLILGLAFVMGSPPPANADAQPIRQPQTQTVIMAGDQIKVKARQLCPVEDACDIDYEGRGVWTITRRTP